MSWRDREKKYGTSAASRKGRGSRASGSGRASFEPRTGDQGRKKGESGRSAQGGLYGQFETILNSGGGYGNWVVTSIRHLSRDSTGKPVYLVSYQLPDGRGKKTKTFTLSNGKLGAPNFQGSGIPEGASPQSNASLRSAQDTALTWLAQQPEGWASPNEMSGMQAMVQRATDPDRLREQMRLIKLNGPFGATGVVDDGMEDDSLYDIDLSGVGGGGGGGGGGPVYVAPDRRVVEDMAKGMMTSLIGTIDESATESLVNLYMRDHRRNFDSENVEIVPEQSMLEAIRQTAAYQTIHELRPDSEDERTWVSQRRAAAAQGGLSQGAQEDFSIAQATVGGDLPDVAEGAAMAQVGASGSVQGTLLEDRLRQVTSAFFSGAQ